jgi:site-specific DNA-methyltransferase (adenine-specific)
MREPFYADSLTTLYHGDCLDVMAELAPASFDAVICDPPYGTTACAWDSVIPFAPMWAALRRLVKPRAAIALFGQEPFSSALRASNFEIYKYDWVWVKTRSSDFLNNKNRPREIHELISVFSNGTTANGSPNRMTYHPQGLVKVDRRWHRPKKYESEHRISRPSHALDRVIEFTNYPETILYFANPNQGTLHPTQKPLALMEYLVRTYTNEGDRVLDFTAGSGTTLRACKNLRRSSVGIEQDRHYCDVTVKRLAPTFEAAIVDNGAPLDALPLFAQEVAE